MKTLPKLPYMQNIVKEYRRQHGSLGTGSDYKNWLKQFGFKVPVYRDYLEFPDDFSDQKLLMFTIRFGG